VTAAFSIGGVHVPAGAATTVHLSVARRYSADDVNLPVRVLHGKKPGPCVFVSAAIHGDEINGIEIVRRLVGSARLRGLRGTLLAVPVVNVYGFLQQTRYLPDRRDLNRSFPGSERGSLTARLAHVLCSEIVNRADVGIDLHTGSQNRSNLPQIRASLEDEETKRLARAFGAPVILDSPLREGSLREVCASRDMPLLVYEGGEALRFDELAIRAGLRGVLGVMGELEMLGPRKPHPRPKHTFIAQGSTWLRAPVSGVLRAEVKLGASVKEGQHLATISDLLGEESTPVVAPGDGIVIGALQLPLVNEGDAVYHVAHFKRLEAVSTKIDGLVEALTDDDFAPDPREELER
jgi:predicted deacylase